MVRGEYRSKTKVVIFSDFIFSVILTCSEVLSVHLFIFYLHAHLERTAYAFTGDKSRQDIA